MFEFCLTLRRLVCSGRRFCFSGFNILQIKKGEVWAKIVGGKYCYYQKVMYLWPIIHEKTKVMEENIKRAVAIATQFKETNDKVQAAKKAISELMFAGSEFLSERQKQALKDVQVIIHEIGVASSQVAAEKFAIENMAVSA